MDLLVRVVRWRTLRTTGSYTYITTAILLQKWKKWNHPSIIPSIRAEGGVATIKCHRRLWAWCWYRETHMNYNCSLWETSHRCTLIEARLDYWCAWSRAYLSSYQWKVTVLYVCIASSQAGLWKRVYGSKREAVIRSTVNRNVLPLIVALRLWYTVIHPASRFL